MRFFRKKSFRERKQAPWVIDYAVAPGHQVIVPRRPTGNFKKLVAAIAALAVAIHIKSYVHHYHCRVARQQIANGAMHTANFPAAR